MNYLFCHIALVFIIGSSAFAQQTQFFRDDFGLQGEYTCKGEMTDSLKLKNGHFTLKWREILQDTLATYHINGQFKNYLQSGLWTWELAGWDYTIEPGKSIKPSFNLSGIHEVWRGSFTNGLPNGSWVYAYGSPEVNINSSKVPIRIEVSYEDGRLSGSFKMHDSSKEFPIKITGSCSKDGIADGVWRFEYNQFDAAVIEDRTYSKGVLTHVKTTSSNPLFQSEKTFDRNMDYLARIRGGDSGTISIGSVDFSVDGYDDFSGALLSYYFNHHLHKEWELSTFPYKQNGTSPIFKRFCFPLSDAEVSIRTSITQTSDAIQEKITEAFGLGNILINRKRSLELDVSISYLEKARQQLVVLDSILIMSFEDEFIYHDRINGDLKHLLKEINQYALTYPENYVAEPIELPKIQLKRDIYDFFQILKEFTDELDREIVQHIDVLQSNAIAIRKESEIRTLESKLENDWLTLDSLYAQAEGLGEHIFSYWIKFYLSNKIRDYAKIDDYEIAIKKGNTLLNQMDSLVVWYDRVVSIDSFIYRIDDYYKQMAYNPYTGKYDISLPLKRRFVTLLKTAILPHLMEELIIQEKWSAFEQNFALIDAFREETIRFAFLNEKQDARIEKRLRKESNPNKFVRIFLDYMESR